MSEWVKCSERFPDDDTHVIAAKFYLGIDTPEAYFAWFVNGRFRVSDDALEASNYDGGAVITANIIPTHWMPLPPPPAD